MRRRSISTASQLICPEHLRKGNLGGRNLCSIYLHNAYSRFATAGRPHSIITTPVSRLRSGNLASTYGSSCQTLVPSERSFQFAAVLSRSFEICCRPISFPDLNCKLTRSAHRDGWFLLAKRTAEAGYPLPYGQ